MSLYFAFLLICFSFVTLNHMIFIFINKMPMAEA